MTSLASLARIREEVEALLPQGGNAIPAPEGFTYLDKGAKRWWRSLEHYSHHQTLSLVDDPKEWMDYLSEHSTTAVEGKPMPQSFKDFINEYGGSDETAGN